MATEQINKVISDGIKLLEKFNELLIEAGNNTAKIATDAEKLNSTINKNSKSTKKGADTQKQLTESQKEAERINKQLLSTKAKIQSVESKQNKELIKQKQILTDRNKELKDTIKLEDKQIGTLEKLAAQNRKLVNERKKLNLETKTGRDRLKTINTELDKNNKFIKGNNDALGKQKINIGNYGSALDSLPGPLRGVVSGTQAFSKALLVLLANPIVAIITGIVAAFTLLIAAFSKTEKGADTFNKVFAQISAVFDVIIGRVAKLADAVGFLLAGKFKEARNAARDAFADIRAEVNETVKAAGAIEDLKISIFEDETEFIRSSARRKKEIQELIILTRDNTKSFEERHEALRKANKIELSLISDEVELQRQRVQLAKDELAATPENLRSREQKREIATQEAALESAIAQSLARQRELLNRVNELETKRLTTKAKQIADEKALQAAIKAAETEEKLDTSDIDAEIEAEQSKADAIIAIEIEKNAALSESQKKLAEEQLALEERKRNAKLDTLNIIRQVFSDETAIGKIAASIQRADAIRQNLVSLGVITAKSAEAQAKSAAALPFPLNLPLIAGTIAQFVGIIKTFRKSKIPEFASGVTNFKGGVAELAERGSELVKESSGKVWLAENRGLYNLQRGSTVLTAQQTQKELNDKNIVNELKLTRKAIQRQPRAKRESEFDARRKGYWDGYNNRFRNN